MQTRLLLRGPKRVSWQQAIRFIRLLSRTRLLESHVEEVYGFARQNSLTEHVVILAEVEGVSGLLYAHLKGLGLLGSLPKSCAEHLEYAYWQTAQQTLAIRAEAEALSSRLEHARIPVLALQGLSLGDVYEDPGLRLLGDADLMVKPKDKDRLKALLTEAGYETPASPYPDLLHKDGNWVDIHTHILNLERIRSRRYLFPEDLTAMWDRAVPFSDRPGGLQRLDPYDNFIALAAHALKHSYTRLIWVADLHESLLKWCQGPNDWEEMARRAGFWRQERVVLYALLLMEGAFGLTVPLWVKASLGIQRLNTLERHLVRLQLKGFRSNELCYPLWLCNIRGLGRKMRFVGETVFPRQAVMTQVFPDHSPHCRVSLYAKRLASTFKVLGRNLRQGSALWFRSGGNG